MKKIKKLITTFKSPLACALKDFHNYFMFERGFSNNSWISYEREIKRFLNYMLAKNLTNFDQINQMNFTHFLSTLYESGLCANSVRHALAACKSFFRFLKREEVIKINVIGLLESPKIWQKIPNILTTEEVIKLIEAPGLSSRKGARDRAILELLYSSGLRVSELCDLKFKHFDLVEKTLVIFGKGSKQRIVPFNKSCLAALCHYWLQCRPNIGPEDFAFLTLSNHKMSRIDCWRSIKAYANKCGLGEKNIHPHTFRHCFATHLLDNGAEVRVIQELLGHVDISTTGIYLQLSLKKLKQKFYKHHPRNEAVDDTPIDLEIQAE